MDDILVNIFLRRLVEKRLKHKLFNDLNSVMEPSCNHCNRRCKIGSSMKCIFCEKLFCLNCLCQENQRICQVCNFKIASNVSFPVLNNFSVKELRVLSDNYNISTDGIFEKESLIEAILKKFQKSLECNTSEVVDVNLLRAKMENQNLEEKFNKEKVLKEEQNKSKIFANYSNITISKETIDVTFKSNDVLEISIDEISTLSVKKMKEILDRYNIDYTKIVEKKELVSLIEQLCEHYKKFQNGENKTSFDKKTSECGICMNSEISCAFLDCRHSMCCYSCGQKLSNCPICRKSITQCLQIFLG